MAQKILLQINCKLGGELWGVDIPLVSGAEICLHSVHLSKQPCLAIFLIFLPKFSIFSLPSNQSGSLLVFYIGQKLRLVFTFLNG